MMNQIEELKYQKVKKVTLFGAFYQPFTDAMKGVWSDDSRIELHFGKAEKIKKSFKLEESNNVG